MSRAGALKPRPGSSGYEDVMRAHLHTFLAAAPLAAIALAVALGYLCGKIRIGTFVLSPVAATLLLRGSGSHRSAASARQAVFRHRSI